MQIIDLNKQVGVELLLFPDNQPHIALEKKTKNKALIVYCSITDSKKLLELCMLDEILNRNLNEYTLHIPYLMGARYDRVMAQHESFDLKAICNIINILNYKRIYLYDIHSDVAPALLRNCKLVSNIRLVEKYERENAVLIVPDAGAAKKAHFYQQWNKNITDVVYCIKHRDLTNGRITLKVLEPEKCKDRNCVIIDDLCDGGATFNLIDEQIKPLTNTLIVTHGIFSRGFKELENHFTEIITSNSYRDDFDSKIVKVINWY